MLSGKHIDHSSIDVSMPVPFLLIYAARMLATHDVYIRSTD